MHRSGTSCLTGCLEEAGLALCDVNSRARYNTKGNRENRSIMVLHDALLADNGGAWDVPPSVPLRWSAERLAKRDALIAQYPADRLWGFKDPRTVFTLEGWLEALPQARLVGTVRHPMMVAQSLKYRDGFAVERALALWLAYNRRLETLLDRHGGQLVCFDWPRARYVEAVAALARAHGLIPPKQGFSFFESALRHSTGFVGQDMPSEVEALYLSLRNRAVAARG